jgi:hypothetical protein
MSLMNIYRRLLLFLLIFIGSSAISAAVWLATLQITILNREVVKTWLFHSGIYGSIFDSFTQMPDTLGGNIVGSEAAKQALKSTLTPAYAQQQTEQAIDHIYDWLDGKTPTLAFTIPLNQQQGAFADHLRAAIEPSVAALPVCTPPMLPQPDKLACRPPTLNSSSLADKVAGQIAANQDFFNSPITAGNLAQQISGQGGGLAAIKNLPTYRQWVTWLLWILPVTAVLCAIGLYPVATDRPGAYRRLARHIWVGSSISLLLGLTLLYLGTNQQSIPALQNIFTSSISHAFLPLAKQAAQGIGGQLALFSGIVVVIGLAVWIILTAHRKKHINLLAKQPQQRPASLQPVPVYTQANKRETRRK